ncbi:MAG: LemA family protein, partial [Lachnospiraceae bacterium]|nr:LemA family protein [Lachnospiraceae bacterium]
MWIYIAIGGGVLLLLLIILIANYNRFVRLDKKVDEAFSTMDIYLVKRWELIPKLVDTVKGYMAHEKEIFTQIVRLRKGMSVEELNEAKAQIDGFQDRLFAVVEGFPELRASDVCLKLMSG